MKDLNWTIKCTEAAPFEFDDSLVCERTYIADGFSTAKPTSRFSMKRILIWCPLGVLMIGAFSFGLLWYQFFHNAGSIEVVCADNIECANATTPEMDSGKERVIYLITNNSPHTVTIASVRTSIDVDGVVKGPPSLSVVVDDTGTISTQAKLSWPQERVDELPKDSLKYLLSASPIVGDRRGIGRTLKKGKQIRLIFQLDKSSRVFDANNGGWTLRPMLELTDGTTIKMPARSIKGDQATGAPVYKEHGPYNGPAPDDEESPGPDDEESPGPDDEEWLVPPITKRN